MSHPAAVWNAVTSFAATLLGLFLFGAVLGKLDGWRAWTDFAERLYGGAAAGGAVRFGLPLCEGAAGVMLILWPQLGLLAGGVLLAGLAVGVAVAVGRHGGEKCNCFGPIGSSTIDSWLVARNTLLAGIAFCLAGLARFNGAPRPSLGQVTLASLLALLCLVAAEGRRFLEAAYPGRGGEIG